MSQTHIIVGTAGHVDHGKTRLTMALTGIDTDRLPEEKRRGLTIVPGFVPLDLKSGRRLGLIDVPGHEQFVKNMLAGVAGIDMALLVIAADEGVMPQTVEHLNILSLLGINKGVVALTKSDMVDEEWLTMIKEDVKKLLATTPLKDAPVLAVSAQTGENIEQLRNLLDEVAATVEERPSTGLCRLPIDRVFHKQGFGTIVTGTLWSGHIVNGQQLELIPGGQELRVRGIQVHDKPVEEAQAGQRTALNLTGPEVESVKPGLWVAEPNLLQATHRLDVALDLLPGAKNMAGHAPVRVFHGTAEVLGRVRLLDRQVLKSGEKCLCQLELEEELAPLRGDRVILRSYSPVETIAGATVLDPKAPRYKLSDPETMVSIEHKSHLDLGQSILTVCKEKMALLTLKELAAASQMTLEEGQSTVEELCGAGQLKTMQLDNGCLYYSLSQDDTWRKKLIEGLEEYHRSFPLRQGMPLPELRQRCFKNLNVKQYKALLDVYSTEGVLDLAPTGMVSRPGFKPQLTELQEKQLTTLAELYHGQLFAPPEWEEALEGLKLKQGEAQEYLTWLLDNKKLGKIGNSYFAYEALEQGAKVLRASYPQSFTIGEARDVWGTSRKFAQMLLDTLDAQGVTRREGDRRVFLE